MFAPWALPRTDSPLLPRRIRGFVARRALDQAVTVPGWVAVEAGLRAWAGDRADRLLEMRFMLRRAADRLAARWIRRVQPAVVVAPSCAAEWSFAAAREIGAQTILVEDLPDLRGLQRDLDRAAAAHPQSAFLRRYRAPARVAARQEVERLSADRIYVRGHFAWSERVDAGVDPSRLARLDSNGRTALVRAPAAAHRRLLLAGLAAARNGSNEILALAEACPQATLLVRAGQGTEPAQLLAHPRIRVYDGGRCTACCCQPGVKATRRRWNRRRAPGCRSSQLDAAPVFPRSSKSRRAIPRPGACGRRTSMMLLLVAALLSVPIPDDAAFLLVGETPRADKQAVRLVARRTAQNIPVSAVRGALFADLPATRLALVYGAFADKPAALAAAARCANAACRWCSKKPRCEYRNSACSGSGANSATSFCIRPRSKSAALSTEPPCRTDKAGYYQAVVRVPVDTAGELFAQSRALSISELRRCDLFEVFRRSGARALRGNDLRPPRVMVTDRQLLPAVAARG